MLTDESPASTHHLVASACACALEARKLPPVVNGDDHLPGGQQHHAHQQDAADHRQQHGASVGPPAATLCNSGEAENTWLVAPLAWTRQPLGTLTWFFQSGEDRLSAGVLRVRELHETIIVRLIETQHGTGHIGLWEDEKKSRRREESVNNSAAETPEEGIPEPQLRNQTLVGLE